MNEKDLKSALKEASEWHKHATEYELEEIPYAQARQRVLNRIFTKYKKSVCTSKT